MTSLWRVKFKPKLVFPHIQRNAPPILAHYEIQDILHTRSLCQNLTEQVRSGQCNVCIVARRNSELNTHFDCMGLFATWLLLRKYSLVVFRCFCQHNSWVPFVKYTEKISKLNTHFDCMGFIATSLFLCKYSVVISCFFLLTSFQSVLRQIYGNFANYS